MSKRNYDINGWYEVKDNPLSKVGVFPYTGAMIDPNGEFGLDPDKVYNVMRPQEELEDPETIESFKLVPWIDEHVMLGDEKNGLTPPEKKGVSGVIGENVFFDPDDMMLKGNVKVFAEKLRNDIDKGKRELSLGYRCKYERKSGVYDGQGYDFVQKCIRGNHMASVDEGRMGAEVAVLDGNLLTFTIDSKEFKKMAMTPEEMEAALTQLLEIVPGLVEKVASLMPSEDEETEETTEDMEEEETEDKCDTEDEEEKSDSEAMDSLKAENKKLKKDVAILVDTVDGLKKDGVKVMMVEISKRDTLAKSLSEHVGTFDHMGMTLSEVACYGVEKLELDCEKGSEIAALNGYLHGKQSISTGLDSKTKSESMSGLDNYIKGE